MPPGLRRRGCGSGWPRELRPMCVGGRYRNELAGDDGQTYAHSGEYLELEPGRRIVQSFHGGARQGPAPDRREFIEITPRPLGSERTELTLADCRDGGRVGEEGQEAVKAAWSTWLDGLARLSQPSPRDTISSYHPICLQPCHPRKKPCLCTRRPEFGREVLPGRRPRDRRDRAPGPRVCRDAIA